MKKKWIKIAALTMACTMMAASLSGCGARAEATNQEIENGETIIVTENNTPSDSEDEITSTEIIGGNDEAPAEFAGAENEDIVLYEKRGNQDYCPLNESDYAANEGRIIATEDIPLYDMNGFAIGYIKNGATINIDETATDITWSRFENPIAGTEYDYLYVLNEYLVNEDIIIVNEEDLKERIIDAMNNRSYELPTVLDAPTDDMEVFECRMEKEYMDDLEVDYWIRQSFHTEEFNLGRYMTYYVECQDDGDGIICKVYYKDLHESFVENYSK